MKNLFIFFNPARTKENTIVVYGNYSAPRLINYLANIENTECIIFNNNIKNKEYYGNCKFIAITIKEIIRLIVNRYKYDKIFIISQLFTYFNYALLLKILLDGKLIFRTGGVFYGKEEINSPQFIKNKKKIMFYYKLCDLIVSTADTTPVDEYMQRMKVPKERYKKWLNGFPEIINKNNYKRVNQILCVSRLSTEKNVDYVIESFARAKKKLKNKYKLIIVGDGPDKKKLLKLTTELNIDNDVVFEGLSNDLGKYYYSSKLVISGFANNPIIEAIVTDTPVIAIELGETNLLYGYFNNVFVVPYPPGGVGKIKNKYKNYLINTTSNLIVNILNNYNENDYKNKIDYKKYGWEERIKKEINSYYKLYEL